MVFSYVTVMGPLSEYVGISTQMGWDEETGARMIDEHGDVCMRDCRSESDGGSILPAAALWSRSNATRNLRVRHTVGSVPSGSHTIGQMKEC